MEVRGFLNLALVLGLSLPLMSEAVPNIINEIKGVKQIPSPEAALHCNPGTLLFIHTEKCGTEYRSKFKSSMKKVALKGLKFTDMSTIRLNSGVKPPNGDGCLSCLGRCHLNQNGGWQGRYERYQCYNDEIILELLRNHTHSETDASNFEKFDIPIYDREGNGDVGQKRQEPPPSDIITDLASGARPCGQNPSNVLIQLLREAEKAAQSYASDAKALELRPGETANPFKCAFVARPNVGDNIRVQFGIVNADNMAELVVANTAERWYQRGINSWKNGGLARYNYESPDFEPFWAFGPFAQMLWNSPTRFACNLSKVTSGGNRILNAVFEPAGNQSC